MKFVVALALFALAPVIEGKVIFSQNFDDSPLGPYTGDDINRDFPNVDEKLQGPGGSTAIVGGSDAYSGRSFRARVSDQDKVNIFFRIPDGGYDNVYLSYMMTTSPNFCEDCGGKMAGLAGSDYLTRYPSGGCLDDGEFNSKPHFGSGGGHMYTFWYGMPNRCAGGKAFRFRPVIDLNGAHGTWHHIEIRIQVNTPGAADGILQVWWDGDQRVDDKVEWRKTDAHNVERVRINATTTGSDKPPRSENHYIYYDNIVVATTRQGPRGGAAPKVPSQPEGVSVTKQPGAR